MAMRRGKGGRLSSASSDVTEWVGGAAPLAVYVDEATPFRPVLVAWVGPGGVLAGSAAHADEAEAALLVQLRQALRRPMIAGAGVPGRVRVADEGAAAAVRRELGAGVEVVVAPTPEIDAIASAFAATPFAVREGAEPSYLRDGRLPPDLVGGFFAAAARLYRASPWRVVPDDAMLFAVDGRAFGLRRACLSVIGGAGESYGFLLFDSVAGYEALRAAAEIVDDKRGPPDDLGAGFLAVNFERGADLPAALRREIVAHGWPVAGPKAYPVLTLLDADRVERPTTRDDVLRASACCEALARLVEHEGERLAEGAKVGHTFRLDGLEGRPELRLSLPHPDDPAGKFRGDTAALEREIGAWVGAFLADEGKARPGAAWLASASSIVSTLLAFKAAYERPTFGHWPPSLVEAFVLEYLPASGAVDDDDLGALASVLDAFFAWLATSGRGDARQTAALRSRAALATSTLPGGAGLAKRATRASERAGSGAGPGRKTPPEVPKGGGRSGARTTPAGKAATSRVGDARRAASKPSSKGTPKSGRGARATGPERARARGS